MANIFIWENIFVDRNLARGLIGLRGAPGVEDCNLLCLHSIAVGPVLARRDEWITELSIERINGKKTSAEC